MRKLLRFNLWFHHDFVWLNGAIYLERWYCYLLGFTLRLHKFHRGDDDRAVHDHPWPFITFPFTGYWEKVHRLTWYKDEQFDEIVWVKPWRFHYRPSSYQHIVLGSRRRISKVTYDTPKPFFTFVITGRKDRSWGFWPNGKYVYYRDFH